MPGSEREKRWQDALELLDAGIEVYTTVNVQHVESLNDVVAQITHVQVRETIPDSILERADEIELVDIAPEELLERLREGTVYLPEQAERAREHFFKRGNLLALRELALRRMAERVDADVLAWRQEHGVDAPWQTTERVMVCVGPAPDSARLVRAARRIAAGLRVPWVAASVQAVGRPPRGGEDRDNLEAHLRLAESLGAEVVRLTGVHIADAILEFARRRNVTRIVLGKPRHARWRDLVFGSLVDQVIRGSGDIEVNVLSGASEGERPRRDRAASARTGGGDYLRAAAVIAATTLLARAIKALVDPPDVVMLFLLGVMIASGAARRGAALMAAALAVAAYDFFFVPPALTFAVADARYLLTFAMLFGVSVFISTVTIRLREERRAAVERERRTAAVFALSRELGAALDEEGVAAVCARAVSEATSVPVVFLHARGRDELVPISAYPREAELAPSELAVARWALDHGQAAGRGTDTLPGEAVLCVPLRTWGEALAVVAVRPSEPRGLGPEHRNLLDAFVRQTALALDRVRLAEEARQAALRARTEELRSGLLSAVSHDLRTPLAAITGAGTMLRSDVALEPELRRDLVDTICEEAERLERLLSNLLDMTRLESGAVTPRREWVPLDEVIGAALTRLERRLAGRQVTTTIAEDVPLLSIDPVLVEQLFLNLLENAAKYTPPGSEIEIRAAREGGTILVEVADHGPGLTPGDEERVFERFYRGAHASVRGVGLGLPIARAIAQAHGGRLAASNRPGGGCVFRLTLPVPSEPPPAAADAPAGTTP